MTAQPNLTTIPTILVNGVHTAVGDDVSIPVRNVSTGANSQTVHMALSTDSTLIAYMVVDLSDTTNWKHTNTGSIVLDYFLIQVDPTNNFSGEIKLGFLTNVDSTDGDFNQILDVDMKTKADILVESMNFESNGFHCSTTAHFGPVMASSTLFQTDVNIGGPDDPATPAYPSGSGDLVLIVDGDGANAVDVSLTIGYETLV